LLEIFNKFKSQYENTPMDDFDNVINLEDEKETEKNKKKKCC
jgi:hypothetical protein